MKNRAFQAEMRGCFNFTHYVTDGTNLPLTNHIPGVDSDAHQPGLFTAIAFESVHAAEGLEEGFLHRVPGEIDVPQVHDA